MNAVGVLQQHPYYAVTDEKGAFEIQVPIPPGRYRLHFWHLGWTYQAERKDARLAGIAWDPPVSWSREVLVRAGQNDLGEVSLTGK